MSSIPFETLAAGIVGALVLLLLLLRVLGRGRSGEATAQQVPSLRPPEHEPSSARERAPSSHSALDLPPSEREIEPPAKSDIRALGGGLPRIAYDEDDEDATYVGEGAPRANAAASQTTKIVYDTDAEPEEPTQASALILVSATGQTDPGRRRKRNEDSLLVLEDVNLFVVADGMGGYTGGAVASKLAVDTIAEAFKEYSFGEKDAGEIPKRARELARAVQMANEKIYRHAQQDRALSGMGTTVCAARFSPNKQRLYLAHVGDSRVYRLRGGNLRQMTADHTMKDLGVGGASATHLSRAVGVWPRVSIDVVLGKPLPGDVYMLCSDGLSKMVTDEVLAKTLGENTPKRAAELLIEAANANGGLDNVTVIVIRVDSAKSTRAA